MNLRIKLIIFIICLLFIFPSKVHAGSLHRIYYLKPDISGQEVPYYDGYYFEGEFSAEEKAVILFSNLINNDNEKYNYIPKGSRLLGVSMTGRRLTINLSPEILGYGGGSHYEICLIRQILNTAFDIDGVEYVTLLVDGVPAYFPEGSVIDNVMKAGPSPPGYHLCRTHRSKAAPVSLFPTT